MGKNKVQNARQKMGAAASVLRNVPRKEAIFFGIQNFHRCLRVLPGGPFAACDLDQAQ
jgi:hypothetical protein